MKLDKRTFNYCTESEKLSFEVQLNVSKDGRFYFNSGEMPKEIVTIGQAAFKELEREQKHRAEAWVMYVYSAELKPLLQAIETAIELYEASLVRRDELKIIVYEFDLEGEKAPPESEGEYTECFGDPASSWRRPEPHTLKINFRWRILRQLTNNSAVRRENDVVYLNDEGTEQHINGDEKIVAWTKEREAWFHQVEGQMRGLMLGLEKFMGLEERQVEKLIATGSLLLKPASSP
jgi:hypothetical protein